MNNYLDGLNVKAKGTSPEKLVSNPSKGNTSLNVTVKVQSLALFGDRNLLFRDKDVLFGYKGHFFQVISSISIFFQTDSQNEFKQNSVLV